MCNILHLDFVYCFFLCRIVLYLKQQKKMKLTLFNEVQAHSKKTLSEFIERGQLFRFMVIHDAPEVNREKTNYAFGAVGNDGKMYWFFSGNTVCNDRKKALSVFLGLEAFCEISGSGKAFAVKSKK